MGYMHIQNFYKFNEEILALKWCYAMEKINGTSAHIAWKKGHLSFFSGGASHERFVKLFDQEKLAAAFTDLGQDEVTVYGEAYGGSMEGMSATYGKEMKFIAFDVRIGESWLAVPKAENVAVKRLGLEFVHYVKVDVDIKKLDAERDADSVQAVRNGIGPGKKREGIVIRPPFEAILNNGDRLMAKHKCDDFAERATPQPVIDPAKLAVLSEAEAVAAEWVTPMRLRHVLDKMPQATGMEHTKDVIAAMVEDVMREAAGEIVDSPPVRKAIGKKTAELFKKSFQDALAASADPVPALVGQSSGPATLGPYVTHVDIPLRFDQVQLKSIPFGAAEQEATAEEVARMSVSELAAALPDTCIGKAVLHEVHPPPTWDRVTAPEKDIGTLDPGLGELEKTDDRA